MKAFLHSLRCDLNRALSGIGSFAAMLAVAVIQLQAVLEELLMPGGGGFERGWRRESIGGREIVVARFHEVVHVVVNVRKDGHLPLIAGGEEPREIETEIVVCGFDDFAVRIDSLTGNICLIAGIHFGRVWFSADRDVQGYAVTGIPGGIGFEDGFIGLVNRLFGLPDGCKIIHEEVLCHFVRQSS